MTLSDNTTHKLFGAGPDKIITDTSDKDKKNLTSYHQIMRRETQTHVCSDDKVLHQEQHSVHNHWYRRWKLHKSIRNTSNSFALQTTDSSQRSYRHSTVILISQHNGCKKSVL